jgi:hypothetical protein
MSIAFTSEEQLLQEGFRAAVIKEMTETVENIERKAQALRRHEIYRDENSKWVMKGIEKEGFKTSTVEMMRNRASNISIARKIINKLAQTYVGGVARTVEDAKSQESIDKLADELEFDTRMKKSDRYRQLQKNTLVQIVPVPNLRETNLEREAGTTTGLKYDLQIKILAPFEYDVIEQPFDETSPGVVILTDFAERARFLTMNDQAGASGFRTDVAVSSDTGDLKDQTIADSPSDKGAQRDKRTFIWWSDKYHFTTDINGQIVQAPDGLLNPIGVLPFVNIASDQDGHYWAQGGEDVIEGSLVINKKMTDINFISFVQGWGQLVVAAKDVPKKLVGGPDNAFIFSMEQGDPAVQVFYASSNPPIADWLETVRTIIALLLSTNDLSSSNISATLDSKYAVSGISKIIDNMDLLADGKDTQKLYQDKEPEIWEIVRRWHSKYSETQSLTKRFLEIPVFEDANVNLKFTELQAPVSELEKLQGLQLRETIGISTLKDLVMMDNPDLTDDEAEKKVEELMQHKKDMQALVADAAIKAQNTGLKNGGEFAPGDGGNKGSGGGNGVADTSSASGTDKQKGDKGGKGQNG